ncbi:hypothetical protein [Paraburkholderia bannensis]|uniref:hypothetical protein n=1 Tax=Paraburkholderia bannensis TaxID=765414 RepID=UPI002ABDBBB9|nr:hypothetical protein [Paraburkholderia bannensis]
MTALQKVNLGTAPAGSDGDPVRAAFVKGNSNVDVLAAQAALTSATQITAAQALTVNHVGKRVNINLASAGTINMPPLSVVTDQDNVLLLRNLGTTVVTLAAAASTSDWVGLTKLNPGESAMMDAFGGAWNVLMRGRARLDNEIVNGSLTVGGKVGGVNSPNMLLNGSGELGSIGWATAVFSALVGGFGEGSMFSNAAALSNYSGGDYSTRFTCGAGVALTLQGEIITGGLTSGTAQMQVVAYDSGGNSLGQVCQTSAVAAGQSAKLYWGTGTTPANTASIAVAKYTNSGTGAAYSVFFRRIKVALGSIPDLHSQEASIAYLIGTPAFTGRPTFAGKTPWDGGNLANPATTDTAQTFTGAKTFSARPTFNGATPWDSLNLPRPVQGATNNISIGWSNSGQPSLSYSIDSGAATGNLVTTDQHSVRLIWNGSGFNVWVDGGVVGTLKLA